MYLYTQRSETGIDPLAMAMADIVKTLTHWIAPLWGKGKSKFKAKSKSGDMLLCIYAPFVERAVKCLRDMEEDRTMTCIVGSIEQSTVDLYLLTQPTDYQAQHHHLHHPHPHS